MTTSVSLSTPPSTTVRPSPCPGLGNHWIGEEERELVLEVLASRHLFRYQGESVEKQGVMTNRMEAMLCSMMGVRYALGVTSGTAALEVAMAALGVGPGDEVIVPAWSWVSCFTSVVRLGALPVLAEADETLCLAPGEMTRLATSRTKAVIVMHYQGVAAEMEPLLAEAKQLGLKVLEDAAQSIGAAYHGRKVGSMGDIAIYSFNYSKTLSAGEGGAVVTNDPVLYERAIRFHDLGFVRPSHTLRLTPQLEAFCGGQYRMGELVAAVVVAQLGKLEALRAHCRGLRERLLKAIGGLSQLEFRRIPDPQGDTGFETYFWLPTAELSQAFSSALSERGVVCIRMTGTYCHYERDYCMNASTYVPHASPFERFESWPAKGYRAEDFPKTEGIIHRMVSLPIGVLYTEEDVDAMAAAIIEVHGELGL